MIHWKCTKFDELTVEELYQILRLRNEVFVVEQNCPYQDCDEKDQASYHLCGWQHDGLKAYTRIIPPGICYINAASIGRVVTSSSMRAQSIGKQLMSRSLENLYRLFGNVPVTIGAQLYLKKFYENFCFVQNGKTYLEDGIPHITMEKSTITIR